MSRDKQNIKTTDWLTRGMTEAEIAKKKEEAIREYEAELRDKQIEEMAKDLQDTHDYEGCEAWHCGGCEYEKYGKEYFCSSIKQAKKMTAKGYRKASDLAEEIFAEIDTLIVRRMIADSPFIDDRLIRDITKLKKKYIGKDTNVTTNTEEGK